MKKYTPKPKYLVKSYIDYLKEGIKGKNLGYEYGEKDVTVFEGRLKGHAYSKKLI